MHVITGDFVEALCKNKNWDIEGATQTGDVFCMWGFRRRVVTGKVSEDVSAEKIRLDLIYQSRYGINPRSQRLFDAYNAASEGELTWQYPNTLMLGCDIPVRDEEDTLIEPGDLDMAAYTVAQHFLELITAYEVCARMLNPDTRDPEKYRKVLPSRQLSMIYESHEAS